jgi:hypothetical protein
MTVTITADKGIWAGLEPCACCGKLTATWYEPKDVALCNECAESVEDHDIPTKEQWFAEHYKRRYSRGI